MLRKGFLLFSAIMTVLSFTVLSLALAALFYNPTEQDRDSDILGPMPKHVYSEYYSLESGFYAESFDELISLLPEQGENFLFPSVNNEDLFKSSGIKGAHAWYTIKNRVSYMLKNEASETDDETNEYSAYKIIQHVPVDYLKLKTTIEHYYQSRPECGTYILTNAPKNELSYSEYSTMDVSYHAMPESMFTNRVFDATKYISFDKNDYNKETLVNAAGEGTPYTDMYNIMWEDIAVEGVDAQMFLVLFVTRGAEENKDVFEFKCYSTFVLDGFRYFISVDMISYYGDINKLNLNQSDYGTVKEFARYYQEKYLEKLLQTE